MASHLKKLQLAYHAEQDRLLLTLATHDLSEYRLWITRRMLKDLWDLLQQVLKRLNRDPTIQQDTQKEASTHITTEQQHPTAKQYAMPISRYPLGQEPILLRQLSLNIKTPQIIHVILQDIHGNTMEFDGDPVLLDGLSQLIQQVSAQTDWGLFHASSE